LRRAEWLSLRNNVTGDLIVRRAWEGIAAKMVEMAKTGNIAAMKLCADSAWPEELTDERSHLSASVSIENLLGTSESDEADELQDDDRQSEGGDR